MNKEKRIFFTVLFSGFVIQMALRAVVDYSDRIIFANQIQYFLTHDPREFDLLGAYGHPGTTVVELGSLLHIFFGVSYVNAVTLSISILIAGATAACSVLCFLLYRRSLWWLAAAFILLLNRMYIIAAPPTAVVMPFIVLIVLATWWLWEQPAFRSRWVYILMGAVMGLAIATRLDISLLVSTPMFFIIWYRHRYRVILPLLAGAGISFFIADPFLWFMPLQHISDLIHKFTLHYTHYLRLKIDPFFLLDAGWLSAVSFIWSIVLFYHRRLARIIPVPIMIVVTSTTILGIIVVFSSKFQAVRYLFPLFTIWEIILPLFAFETLATYKSMDSTLTTHQETIISSSIIVLVVLTQLLAYQVIFM
jgi:hypothetical protein